MRHKKLKNRYVLKLERGEDILKTVENFLEENNIVCGKIQGIGAVEMAKFGFFDGKKYISNTISKNLEVLSLVGNISLKDGKPLVHAHITLANSKGEAFGGHLMEGCRVSATLEVFIETLDTVLKRKLDKDIGLFLWDI